MVETVPADFEPRPVEEYLSGGLQQLLRQGVHRAARPHLCAFRMMPITIPG
jgi:hypothetical protein